MKKKEFFCETQDYFQKNKGEIIEFIESTKRNFGIFIDKSPPHKIMTLKENELSSYFKKRNMIYSELEIIEAPVLYNYVVLGATIINSEAYYFEATRLVNRGFYSLPFFGNSSELFINPRIRLFKAENELATSLWFLRGMLRELPEIFFERLKCAVMEGLDEQSAIGEHGDTEPEGMIIPEIILEKEELFFYPIGDQPRTQLPTSNFRAEAFN